MNTYAMTNILSRPDVIESAGAYQIMVGNDKDFLSTRTAYKLNLRGPAIGVQTACSTSLVAVQMAFESLLRGECDMALAGGVSIPVPQNLGYMYVPGMILSRDGHCRAFDAESSGTVPGAGAGAVVLKRLEDALAEGDHIYAVIRGAAINNDGSSKVGYSAPSVEGQAAVIAKSMAMAGFAPGSIGYIEAHGTGTEVGDPIEFTALARVFEAAAERKGSCALGAVKTNIGHLDTASGVAGLIKAALAIQHRAIPATLHFRNANPLIDFKATPFYVNTDLTPVEPGRVFRAGVSSFGIGGTNAHVSLEEAPALHSASSRGAELIVLSAKTAAALDQRMIQLESYLDAHPFASLADIAFTLQTGRKPFRHRQAMVASSAAEWKAALQARSSAASKLKALRAESAPGDAARVAFLFPGQGSQYVNMGRDLYEGEPVFRETVDRCCEILKPHLRLDLRTVLYPGEDGEAEAAKLLAQTAMTQPALFVIEYAMAQLWMSCGVRPDAMLGHSVGEYVAACLAGVFSLEEGLALIAERGRLTQTLPGGTMLAVGLDEQDLEPLLAAEVSIAATNSPGQTVASGSEVAIALLEAALLRRKIQCRRLRTSHAFHSRMMQPIVAEFVERVAKVKLLAPTLRYLSNVTGTWITPEEAMDPEYWGAHLRRTVRFAECAAHLTVDPDMALIEAGPGDTLLTLVRGKSPATDRTMVASMRHPLAAENDREFWLGAAGRLWVSGAKLDWKGFHAEERRLKVSLPSYPFQRQRYCIEPGKAAAAASESTLLARNPDPEGWFYAPSWRRGVVEMLPRAASNEATAVRRTWLVFCEDGPLMTAMRSGLGGESAIIQVRAGKSFRRITAMSYEIDPADRAGFDELMRELSSRGMTPDNIVHGFMAALAPKTALESAIDLGVHCAMALVQALEELAPGRPVVLNVVTERAYSVFGEAVATPAASALNAFCGAVPVELPQVTVRVIDVDLRTNHGRVAQQVVRELNGTAKNETIAYRGNSRWIATHEPLTLPERRPGGQEAAGVGLRQGGTYMITGGTGGVGLVLARHLAQRVKARLILVSRNPLPPAGEWPALLADALTPAARQKIEGVQAIAASGGEFVLIEADTADTAAMLEISARIRAQYGAIHGIIHAAGIANAGMIVTRSREQMLATLAAKAQGVEWIRESLGEAELDFAMLCSSISAVVPGFGLSDYAAANAYLDAFAEEFDDPQGTRVISVGWDAWREVGMAADAPVPAGLETMREDRIKHGLLSREAEEVFDRILECPLPQVLISTRSVDALQKAVAQGIVAARVPMAASGPANTHNRPETMEEFVATEDELERFILKIWQELLGIDAIGANDNFFQLGGHSLLGTQVLARLQERFGVSLSLRTIFEAATPAQLAQSVRLASWASSVESMAPELEREEIEL
jgi:acyl transferase domain-containing protein